MDVNSMLDDPEFQGLPDTEKVKVWAKIDPEFGGLPSKEQLNVLKQTGPTSPAALRRKLAKLGSPPSRVISGLAESLGSAAQGIVALPRTAAQLVTHPIETVKNLATGLASYPSERFKEIKADPYKGGARLAGDIGMLAMGYGMGAGGKALGAADVAPAAGAIEGAAPFAVETGSGAASAAARMLVRTPIGSKPVATAIETRNIPVVSAAEKLLPGFRQASEEAIGQQAFGAVKNGFNDMVVAENAAWNPLKAATESNGITVPLTETMKRAEPLYLEAKEAHDALISNLSPSTQRILMKATTPTKAGAGMLPATSMGESTDALLAKLPPSAREQVLAQYQTAGPQVTETPASWVAVHQARTEIGSLLHDAQKASKLGSNNTRVLNQIYGGLSEDLNTALKDHPNLQAQFAQASATTAAKHAMYDARSTITQKMMEPEPAVMPSQIIDKVLSGTPESARSFMKATNNYGAAQDSVARGVIERLLDNSSGGRFGEGILDGPQFKKLYIENRNNIKELVKPDILAKWDGFANEVGKYELTRGSAGAPAGIMGRIASLAEFGAGAGAAKYALTGQPGMALSLAAPLLGGRFLVNAMLQPEGPGLVARFFRTGKWAPVVGKGAKLAIDTGVLLPPSVRQQKKQNK
jgi:hypothetical protein